MALLAAAIVSGHSLMVAGCGSGENALTHRATGAGRQKGLERVSSPVQVIRAWSDSLRAGDVGRATSFFALPTIVQNGTPPFRLTTRAQVRAFNASLSCGARLERTFSSAGFTTAVFTLTERPGPGRCSRGTGQTARTTFVIRGGKIHEWRRVPNRPKPSGPVV